MSARIARGGPAPRGMDRFAVIVSGDGVLTIDTGRITLFDERIVSKFYGQAILNSLPPYRRDIFPAALQDDMQLVK